MCKKKLFLYKNFQYSLILYFIYDFYYCPKWNIHFSSLSLLCVGRGETLLNNTRIEKTARLERGAKVYEAESEAEDRWGLELGEMSGGGCDGKGKTVA